MMFFAIQQMDTLKKSRLNFEQATLQMRKMEIHEQITELQEKQENMAAAFSQITSGVANEAGSIFNQSISEANTLVSDAQKAYSQAKSQGLDADSLKFFEEQLTQAKEDSKNAQQQAYAELQRQNSVVASLTQTFKNVQAAEQKAQEKELNKEEARIEIRLNEIKSQMTMIDQELQSASQASEQRSQQLAPKYA